MDHDMHTLPFDISTESNQIFFRTSKNYVTLFTVTKKIIHQEYENQLPVIMAETPYIMRESSRELTIGQALG